MINMDLMTYADYTLSLPEDGVDYEFIQARMGFEKFLKDSPENRMELTRRQTRRLDYFDGVLKRTRG